MKPNERKEWEDIEFVTRSVDAILEQKYEDSMLIMQEGLETHIKLNSIIKSDKFLKLLLLLLSTIETEMKENFAFQFNKTDKNSLVAKCSFCSKLKNETKTLIMGANGCICETCVSAFKSFIEN